MSSRGPAAGRGAVRRTAGRSGSTRSGQDRSPRERAGRDRAGREPSAERRPGRALRAGVVAALAVVCLLSVLAPLTTYVREQSSTATLTRQVEEATQRKAALDVAVDRWDDPAFVSAQARARLHYVRPGETGYVALGLPPEATADALASRGASAPGAGAGTGGADTTAAGGDTGAGGPWYGRLWRSVEVAGQR